MPDGHSKVVHISTVRPSMEVRVFHHECKSLADEGYQVELIIHDVESDRVVDGVQIRSLGTRSARRGLLVASRLRAVWKAATRLREGRPPALVHLHDPELIPLGWWLKLTSRSKVVYDSAENYTAYMKQKYFLPTPIRWLLTYVMAAIETTAAWWFDAIVTADQGTSDIFARRGGKRVTTIHNFPVLEIFDVPRIPDTEKTHDLVYHGSIPKYHLEAAFRVAAELQRRGRSVRWLFVGACHDEEWARQTLHALELTPQFEFKGRVHHDQVAPLVAQARIGFIPLPDLPKFRQNIPMKLFEFMALSLPVVLTDLPPSRPFVGDEKCALLVPPDNPTAFADAIERLLDDMALRQSMGEEGRIRVEREFNWGAEARKLTDLYRVLLN